MASSMSENNEQAVLWLLNRMKQLWGKSFVDKWGMLAPGEMLEIWSKGLRHLTELEFRRGVTKLNQIERPLNLPEFLKLCRPEINTLNAYYEAVEGSRRRELGEVGTWTHPAIFWASVRVTAFELKNQTYSQIRNRWEAALSAELAKEQWEAIEAPKLALPPANVKVSREAASRALRGVKIKTGPGSDPKKWARLIVQRHEQGDKTLLPVQLKFAREALRLGENENE